MKPSLHSLLFVPAKEKLLAKIPLLEADAFIIDLEDSILEAEKEQALSSVVSFFNSIDCNKKCFIRLNSSRLERELLVLQKIQQIVGYMVPKVESINFLPQYAELLDGKKIIVLIETPLGIVNLPSVVETPEIDSVALGAEDLTAEMGMDNTPKNLAYAKSRLLTIAKAYKKKVYDTPSFNVRNPDLFKKEVEETVSMGFDGKLAIHPSQVPIINESFRSIDLDVIRQIVDKFESSGVGVLEIDNKIYEKPHIERLKKILLSRS